MRKHCLVLLAAAFLAAGCAGPRLAAGPADGIPYPPREPMAEEIYHVPTGLRLDFEQLVDMVSAARVVYIGEMHSNLKAHEAQLEVIRALNERSPGTVAIGMEMFRPEQQPALDRWVRGELSELEFLRDSRWYENWGSDFGYYRQILTYARDNGLDVVALNPPREQQEAVRKGAMQGMAEEGEPLPEMGEKDPYQWAVARAVYAGHLPSEGMFESFYRVQVLWEESMAQRVVDYLESDRGRDKRMVVLAGGWHVQFGFGVPKKVLRRRPMPYAIILPEELSLPEEKLEELTMDVELPELPLLRGDFIWMVPYDDLEEGTVKLGVRMIMHQDEVLVEGVEEGSPAEAAGILPGDALRSFDGEAIRSMGDLKYLVSTKRDGDAARVVVRRGGEEIPLEVTFFPLPGGQK